MRLSDLRDWPVSTRFAAGSFVLALMVNAAVLLQSSDMKPTPPLMIAPAKHIAARPADDAELIREAGSRTPFGGVPAAQILASDAMPQLSVAAPPVRPRVLGTVIEARNGGFVLLEMPGARVQVVRIGEKAGDLRLRSVAPGEAVFDDADGERITLRALSPASKPESRP